MKTYHPYNKNANCLIPLLMSISQSLFGFIFYKKYSTYEDLEEKVFLKNKNSSSKNHASSISFKLYKRNDSNIKIWILILFTSFYNSIGAVIRSDDVVDFGKKEENNHLLEIRVRSIQIITSALLCHFTIRLTIYRHQKVTLRIITFFLIIILAIELFNAINIADKILATIICTMSCLIRSFSDVTEKYLFDYDYINIFKMLIYEGLMGIFLKSIYFISSKSYKEQAKTLLTEMSEFDWRFVTFILLVIMYVTVSGLRNAYRVKTNKYYSPMARTLIESTIDPIMFIFNNLKERGERIGHWFYFSSVLFCLTIISFFALVYNDLIVLNCCGLEYDTYYGIMSRLGSLEQEVILIDEQSDDKKNIKMNVELEEKDTGSRSGFEISDYKFQFN